MANKNAVWGIDIGQVALKALRCTPGAGPNELVADRFDYIEFPKMLNQPEAEPEQMIRDALAQFLARNEVRGDKVAISVPGQSGLSRFFRPPPVEEHTLPDIVKYEVKQQIPFPIEDVIWDWQQLGGISVDDRVVDAEVGLFAMKREAVFRSLKPFDDASVEVDLVQLSPLAVFNYVTHDVLENVPAPEDFDPENPPESVVVISMGTDTTDLIVTNGIKLWLRNIPVGGNHFTKQLSRELKLTHAKAEQLKRNARQAEDPKQLFKAMRPVFNDLVNEIQRSLTFFRGIDKTAKISKIVLLGNSANLPGLRQFLNQQLEMDIAKVTEFRNLSGADVIKEKSFENNLLSFAPAYGLCIQGLNQGRLKTNLLPAEIQTERIVRAKKPWVLAALSLMMLGMLAGFKMKENAHFRVDNNYATGGISNKEAKDRAQTQVNLSRQLMTADADQKTLLEKMNSLNHELTSSSENKATWIEFGSAIVQALPKDERTAGLDAIDPNTVPFEDRKDLYIDHLETKFFKELNDWYVKAKPIYDNQFENLTIEQITGAVAAQPATDTTDPTAWKPQDPTATGTVAASNAEGIVGPGWVVELKGHHFHNSEKAVLAKEAGKAYLLQAFVDKLVSGELDLPGNESEGGGKFKYSDFGILLPTIVERSDTWYVDQITLEAVDNPNAQGTSNDDSKEGNEKSDESQAPGDQGSQAGQDEAKPAKNVFKARRYDFTIQIAWIPRSAKDRVKARAARLEREKAAMASTASGADASTDAAAQPNTTVPTTTPLAPQQPAPQQPADNSTTTPDDGTSKQGGRP